MSHLFFIGYRGSGKSTVERLAAAKLQRPFLDSDALIEAAESVSIPEIFAERGEAAFRELEEEAVREAAACSMPTVISLGGGAILRESNRERIRSAGCAIWLRGSAESLYTRIQGDGDTKRPDLTDRGGYDEVVEMLKLREPIYADLANLTVDTDKKAPDEILNEIVRWLETKSGA
ncbi:MAG: shikimate kinase [Planctomycetota bacterium]